MCESNFMTQSKYKELLLYKKPNCSQQEVLEEINSVDSPQGPAAPPPAEVGTCTLQSAVLDSTLARRCCLLTPRAAQGQGRSVQWEVLTAAEHGRHWARPKHSRMRSGVTGPN